MKILLKLKHWQLFLILFIPALFPTNILIGRIFQLVWFGIFALWIYTIGTTAYQKLPAGHKVQIKYFRFSFLFVILWVAVVSLFFDGAYNINQGNYQEFGNALWLILPLHFYTMWSIFYIFYFAAKMLVSSIEGKVVGFSKAFGYFFAFWFFPIGIWFIQPKAQRLIT